MLLQQLTLFRDFNLSVYNIFFSCSTPKFLCVFLPRSLTRFHDVCRYLGKMTNSSQRFNYSEIQIPESESFTSISIFNHEFMISLLLSKLYFLLVFQRITNLENVKLTRVNTIDLSM